MQECQSGLLMQSRLYIVSVAEPANLDVLPISWRTFIGAQGKHFYIVCMMNECQVLCLSRLPLVHNVSQFAVSKSARAWGCLQRALQSAT